MKSRVIILCIAFLLLFAGIVARLFYLQVLPNQALERLKKSQYTTMVQLPSQRGKILDRKGEELATSVSAQSLYADPGMIKTPKRLSKQLAKILGMNKSEVFKLLTSDRRFVWIKRQIDNDDADQIKELKEPGLRLIEEGRRAYPNQSLFAQTLGFVGADGNGLEGIERKYDSELRGEKQSVLSRRDARGRPLVVSGQIFETHADGATLETTIDKDLQYRLERELEDVTIQQQAEKSTGIIMDPNTGEILAMASYPSYEPAKAKSANPELRRNKAVTDIFEPGSTFKIVMAAAALRTGKILPNTKFFCENGSFKIGKRTIHEAEGKDKWGWLTLSEILEVSSNIGSTKVAFEVGQEKFRDMAKAFGFGSRTGIDFPGEAQGLIVPGDWPEHLFSNVSFGHGVGVTAIQMANAYSTIANGGKLMRPFIIKRVIDSDNRIVEERKPELIREVLSPKESSMMTLMLSGVTQDGGTGTLARVDGYPVAGKTGTAQKVNPNGKGYLPHSYVSSFVGFVPANNPQFTIYIVVDNPRKHFYGAQVAAPIFNHVASFALHERGFMPVVAVDKASVPANEKSPAKSKPRAAADAAPKNMGVDLLKTAGDMAPEVATMPDLTGLTLREASRVLREEAKKDPARSLGEVQLVGSGIARAQWPPPGQHWTKGQKIRVIFESPR